MLGYEPRLIKNTHRKDGGAIGQTFSAQRDAC